MDSAATAGAESGLEGERGGARPLEVDAVAQSRGIRQRQRQHRPVPVDADDIAGEVGPRQRVEAAGERHLGAISGDGVDRPLQHLGAGGGGRREAVRQGDEGARHLAARLAPVDGDGLGDGVGHDEEGANQGLRAAPALGDLGARTVGVGGALVDEALHQHQRHEQEHDQAADEEELRRRRGDGEQAFRWPGGLAGDGQIGWRHGEVSAPRRAEATAAGHEKHRPPRGRGHDGRRR